MHKMLLKIAVLSIALGASGIVLAQSAASASTSPSFGAQQVAPSPIPLLQNLSNKMISALKQNKASMIKNPDVVYDIVKKILLPSADLEAMARSALGRDAWMSATKDQQQAFVQAFTDLMVHTYAAGLSSYTDEKVNFDPIRGGLQPGQNRVEVNSQIIRTDGPPIPVSYRLIYKYDKSSGQWNWYVYDFSVEGISMIQSFRSQFAADLSAGMSMDQLTKKLVQHNHSANQQSTN
ncbi:MAG: mlaC [Gammaproteobacteria bacterium]|nr:mlaC [Gammaproteobacteria bacterium]